MYPHKNMMIVGLVLPEHEIAEPENRSRGPHVNYAYQLWSM